jgi:hypothetical protein
VATRVLLPSIVAALMVLGGFAAPTEARLPSKGRLTPNVDLMGGDLRRVPLPGRYWRRGGPQHCIQLCRATVGCLAVVTKYRSCYLKRAIGRTRGLAKAWAWINPRPRRTSRPNRRRVTPGRPPPAERPTRIGAAPHPSRAERCPRRGS